MSSPARIDRYEVTGRIGRGGMGTVYHARDPHIGRAVAIKVLTDADDLLLERFRQEARLAGALSHKNIVTIHDYGEHDGRPFIVMEFINGATVAEELTRGAAFSLSERLHVLHDLAVALDYAHNQGVVHRDVKPSNLMLDGHGVLKVLDFGVARMNESHLTQIGMLVGTPSYMSPEQIQGLPVDRRTDIFAFGLTAYEVLTSQKPFVGTMPQVVTAILSEQPKALTAVNPELDPELERIVNATLEKDPAKRYPNLALVAADLARVQERLRGRLSDTISDKPQERTIVLDTAEALAAARVDVDVTYPAPRVETGVSRWTVPESGHAEARAPRATRASAIATLAAVVAITAGILWWRSPASVSQGGTGGNGVGVGTGVPVGTTDTTPTTLPNPPGRDSPVDPTRTPSTNNVGSNTTPSTTLPATSPRGGRGTSSAPTGVAVAPAGVLPANAEKRLQQNCDQGNSEACTDLGVAYQNGSGVQKNASRAATLFQRACDADLARGCNALGIAYQRGAGLTKDDAKAFSLYQRACADSYVPACTNVGLMYAQGLAVAKDEVHAADLFQQSCDKNDGAGCNLIGRAYEFGQGVQKNEARAVAYYQRGCASDNSNACANFGWAYLRGVGVARDEALGVTLLERACNEGNAFGCNNLAFAYSQGRGVPREPGQAAVLYQRACDAGSSPACGSLGLMYARGFGVIRDDQQAFTLFERACGGGNQLACVNMGGAYANGRGVTKDDARAAVVYQRACDANAPDACTRLGTMYESGVGVPRDAVRAASLLQRGRDLLARGGNAGPLPSNGPPDSAPTGAQTVGSGASGSGGGQTQSQNGPLRVGGDIKPPRKIKDVQPSYPQAARFAGVQGIVIIEVTIGPDGSVQQTKVLRSSPLLDGAAEDAVKQWQFAPTIVNGNAVPVIYTVTVNFSLPASGSAAPNGTPSAAPPVGAGR